MEQVTTVIKTLGTRPSIVDAVDSALREGFYVVVSVDGDLDQEAEVLDLFRDNHNTKLSFYCLGTKMGHYGCMAANVGVAMANTEWVSFLDDDDEYIEGAGDIIRNAIKKTDADIIIPGLQFNNGMRLCIGAGFFPGNVAVPIMKRDIFNYFPLKALQPGLDVDYTDYDHLKDCYSAGYKFEWIGKPIYLVRPKLPGTNGRGK